MYQLQLQIQGGAHSEALKEREQTNSCKKICYNS
jgi:hypothetical protein